LLPLLIIFIISLGLGLAHGAEPDHLATISALGKGLRKAVWFAAGHSLGFVLIALPILFVLHALPENDLFKLVADAVSIGIAGIVIYAELSGRELEVGYRSGGGLGIAQGALAFTPTKALLLVLASTASAHHDSLVSTIHTCVLSLDGGLRPLQTHPKTRMGPLPKPHNSDSRNHLDYSLYLCTTRQTL